MDGFSLRRAIERLRDGLFDSVAVNCLTVEKERIENVFYKGLLDIDKGESEPLCICGSYGQGKSHTLSYLNQLALSRGYATSAVQLDAREIPFHQFSTVYQLLMERLSLPDNKKFTHTWKNFAHKDSLEILGSMPHRFRIILKALLCKNKSLSLEECSLKKHQSYRPKEYSYWLERALMGYDLSLSNLKSACKYRSVDGYQEQSLICRGNDPYFLMVQSLGNLLKEMGYKGLVLFFDEAESIAQGRLGQREKSYHLLDQFFQTKGSVFPLFAFTDDFFDKVHHDSYDNPKNAFPKNYAESWRNLSILRLQDFSSHEWESLLDRLIQLYSQAYQIPPPLHLKSHLQSLLAKLEVQETRCKLKALVNRLDIETQHILLNADV